MDLSTCLTKVSILAAAKAYNNTFHMIYQADVTQGHALDEEHAYQDNQIYAVKIGGYWVGLEDFTISKQYFIGLSKPSFGQPC